MDPHDEMEVYLREFRPRTVGALGVAPTSRKFGWRGWAAAASATIAAGGLIWFAHRELQQRRHEAIDVQRAIPAVAVERRYLSTVALTRLALENHEAFETILADESRNSLPTVQGARSTLKALSGE